MDPKVHLARPCLPAPACLAVCLSSCACLPSCLAVYLCLAGCLSACAALRLPGWLAVCLSACACLPAWLPARLPGLSVCLPVCLSASLAACLCVCVGIAVSVSLSSSSCSLLQYTMLQMFVSIGSHLRQLEFHDDLVMQRGSRAQRVAATICDRRADCTRFPDIGHSAQLPKPATACIRSTLQACYSAVEALSCFMLPEV